MPGAHPAWVCMTTLGGGFVQGDAIDLHVEVKPDATLLMTTQASTKIFRGASRQALRANVARHARGFDGSGFVFQERELHAKERGRSRRGRIAYLARDRHERTTGVRGIIFIREIQLEAARHAQRATAARRRDDARSRARLHRVAFRKNETARRSTRSRPSLRSARTRSRCSKHCSPPPIFRTTKSAMLRSHPPLSRAHTARAPSYESRRPLPKRQRVKQDHASETFRKS